MRKWRQDIAVDLCRRIEAICPDYGCHVALTGGCLYKDGPRKDADVLFYRILEVAQIDIDGMFEALAAIGVERLTEGDHWCIKARYHGMPLDCFFPELAGEYDTDEEGDEDESLAELAERLREPEPEPCYAGCSEAECDCARCQAAERAWERVQGWDSRDGDDDCDDEHEPSEPSDRIAEETWRQG